MESLDVHVVGFGGVLTNKELFTDSDVCPTGTGGDLGGFVASKAV